MQYTIVETMYLKRIIIDMLHDITKHIYLKNNETFWFIGKNRKRF